MSCGDSVAGGQVAASQGGQVGFQADWGSHPSDQALGERDAQARPTRVYNAFYPVVIGLLLTPAIICPTDGGFRDQGGGGMPSPPASALPSWNVEEVTGKAC